MSDFLEITIMDSGINQTINGVKQEIKLCVLAPYGKTAFCGKTSKAISIEEHSALLQAKDKEITKLKWQLSQFKCIGTDRCQSCEGGRVSLFMANQECISCNPRSYDTYEQRESLAGGKDE